MADSRAPRPTPLSRRRFLGALGTGAATAAGLSACRGTPSNGGNGGASGGGTTLTATWWGEQSRIERFAQAMEMFAEASTDNVTITPEYMSFDGYFDRLATRVAGGDTPSLFQLHSASLGEYVGRGVVRELDDLVEVLGMADLPENVLDACRVDGRLMLVPLGLATQPTIVVDMTQLAELGVEAPPVDWTLDDLDAIVREIAAASDGEVYGITDLGGNELGLENYIRSAGNEANMFTADGALGFERDTVVEWLTRWADLREAGAVPPMDVSAEATGGFDNNLLVRGRAAMTLGPSSKGIEAFQNLVEGELQLYQFPRRDVAATVLTPIEWFAMSADLSDEQAQTAAELCHYLLAAPEALSLTQLQSGVPLFEEGREQLRSELDTPAATQIFANYDQVSENALWARNPYPPGTGLEYVALLGTINEQVGFGELDVEAAATQFYDGAQAMVTG